jgi:hypothetical protein
MDTAKLKFQTQSHYSDTRPTNNLFTSHHVQHSWRPLNLVFFICRLLLELLLQCHSTTFINLKFYNPKFYKKKKKSSQVILSYFSRALSKCLQSYISNDGEVSIFRIQSSLGICRRKWCVCIFIILNFTQMYEIMIVTALVRACRWKRRGSKASSCVGHGEK